MVFLGFNTRQIHTGKEDYELGSTVLEAIGEACAAAGRTTPSVFESYVEEKLRPSIIQWVKKYEQLYYQYQSDRLPFCTLPVHSLLHLPNYIIDSGPLWTVWSYPTERLCGFIVQLSKSKKNPYASFARRLREIAQLNQIKLLYSLHNELDLSTETSDRRRGLHLNGDRPVPRSMTVPVRNYLAQEYGLDDDEAASRLPDRAEFWGRVQYLEGGDTVLGADSISREKQARMRDSTYDKFEHQVGKYAHRRHQDPVWEWRIGYGQLQRVVRFPIDASLALDNSAGNSESNTRPGDSDDGDAVRAHGRIPFSRAENFAPLLAIDVDHVNCLIARIPDYRPHQPRWEALLMFKMYRFSELIAEIKLDRIEKWRKVHLSGLNTLFDEGRAAREATCLDNAK
ncbi:hypothetical protein BDV98DRAFT_587357 [Pterulicium gracile]|uniref:Uncharacterized protein n=1 Tax=Pterulicium gracile TaxID=1884261 RepID=A0A5C3Q1Z4_9AGAR|nr:hypothetical protein BDV98DRAFT_587357 [Pterula gracilis]